MGKSPALICFSFWLALSSAWAQADFTILTIEPRAGGGGGSGATNPATAPNLFLYWAAIDTTTNTEIASWPSTGACNVDYAQAVASTRPTNVNGRIVFDGSDDELVSAAGPAPFVGTNYTFFAFCQPDCTDTLGAFAGNGAGNSWFMWDNGGGKPHLSRFDNGAFQENTSFKTCGTNIFFLANVSGGAIDFYINGEFSQTVSSVTTAGFVIDKIGSIVPAGFKGKLTIDAMGFITNRNATTVEITSWAAYGTNNFGL